MSISNLNKYRRAKAITKDLEEIIKLLTEFRLELLNYKKYIPVKDVLNTLDNNSVILKSHFIEQRQILKNKGEV